MEMTMRKKILIVLAFPLIAAFTAQAAAASERHHTRTNSRAVAIAHLRNSNTYAAPRDTVVQPGLLDQDEGAMTSGLAGH
jgi:hypothetical protein